MAARIAKKKSIKMNTIPIDVGLITSDIESNGTTPESNGKDLPNGFAEEILKLEMDMEINDKIDLKSLHRLIELYALGVGHYEAIGDSKYQYFHKKMNNLMMKPNVQESMSNSVKTKKDTERRESVLNDNIFANKPKSQEEAANPQSGTDTAQNSSQRPSQNIQQQKQQQQQQQQAQHQPHNSQVKQAEVTHNTFTQEVQHVQEVQEQKEVAAQEKKTKQISLIRKKTIEENIKLNIIYGMQENEDKSKSILKMHQLDQQRVKEFVHKQVENQVDEIKKRLQSRRLQQSNRALSLPNNNDSDTSLSDIDVVHNLHENKIFISSQNNLDVQGEETIEEDEQEDHFTRENSKRNSFDFQTIKDGNSSIIEQLTKERNVDEILTLRNRRKTTMSTRKTGRQSLMTHQKLLSKPNDTTRIRSLSNDHIQNNNNDSINITPFEAQGYQNNHIFNNTSSMIEPQQQ